jgi:hypothetical protein
LQFVLAEWGLYFQGNGEGVQRDVLQRNDRRAPYSKVEGDVLYFIDSSFRPTLEEGRVENVVFSGSEISYRSSTVILDCSSGEYTLPNSRACACHF